LKLRIASLTLLCLALAVIPASAQTTLYDNGPANGTVDAWTINFGYTVSDTFTLGAASTVQGFDFSVWAYPGDTALTVDWSITSAEFGGTTYGSGTASLTSTFISSNQFGYDLDKLTASGLNVAVGAGTYWLNLANATTSLGDPLFWDENSGPSQASESAVGTIASEAFDIKGTSGGTVPEPSSIMLFGSGILGLAGVLRRKLF
jgi:hypothetical protein